MHLLQGSQEIRTKPVLDTKSKPKISLLKSSRKSIERAQNSTKFTDNLESIIKSPQTLKSQSIFHKRKNSNNPRRHIQTYEASQNIQGLDHPQKGRNFGKPLCDGEKPQTSQHQYKPSSKTSPFSVETNGDSPLFPKPSYTFCSELFKPRVTQKPVSALKLKASASQYSAPQKPSTLLTKSQIKTIANTKAKPEPQFHKKLKIKRKVEVLVSFR